MTEQISTPLAPNVRKAAVIFIFITVFIDILSFGLIIPVLPQLVKSFVDNSVAKAAIVAGIFSFAFNFMQFIFSPVQGALSDHFGRRPIILFSNLGTGLDFIFMALAQTLPWLFIGRMISGITSASFSTANAYIADITTPENRAKAFGMIGMAFGIGFTLAPAIGGFLGEIHPRWPFWFAAVLSLANFTYGYFVLPESLPVERRAAFDWKRANPIGSLKLLKKYRAIWGLVGVLFLMGFAHFVYPSSFVLYADYRFDWGPKMVGITLGIVGILSAVVQGVLIGKAIKKFGERKTLIYGLLFGVIGFTLYGFAPTGYWFWAAMPIAGLWGIAGPAAQSMMTRQVDPSEQGRLQGAIASLNSIGGLVAPLIFTNILAFEASASVSNIWHGATWWFAGLLVLTGLVVALRSTHIRAQGENLLQARVEKRS